MADSVSCERYKYISDMRTRKAEHLEWNTVENRHATRAVHSQPRVHIAYEPIGFIQCLPCKTIGHSALRQHGEGSCAT